MENEKKIKSDKFLIAHGWRQVGDDLYLNHEVSTIPCLMEYAVTLQHQINRKEKQRIIASKPKQLRMQF